MEYQYELRIPKERVAVLIGTKGAMKRKIEKATSAHLDVDSTEGEITVSGEDAMSCYTAKDIVAAIGRGFNPDVALQLTDDKYLYEELNMADVARTKKHMIRMKGRVIGSEGKSRKLIEDLTETSICVYGKTVGIIGETDTVPIAKKALESLLAGSPHSTVYSWLEKQRARLKRQQVEDM